MVKTYLIKNCANQLIKMQIYANVYIYLNQNKYIKMHHVPEVLVDTAPLEPSLSREFPDVIPDTAEVLRGYPDALGRAAVDAETKRVGELMATGQNSPSAARDVKKEIKDVRRQMQALSRVKDSKVHLASANYLEVEKMPEWLRRATGSVDDPTALVHNFANKRKIDDATALNVLQWRADRLSEYQREFEQTIVPELKQRATERVERAVQAGWMPGKVLERLGRVDTVPVYGDDGISTLQLSNHRGSTDGGSIALAPDQHQDERVFEHEVVHVLGNEEEARAEHMVEVGGITSVFRTERGAWGIGLNEALTERIANGLVSGDIDNPFVVKNNPAYEKGQELLDALMTKGLRPVNVRLFVNAYFEADEERKQLGPQSASSQLIAALQAAFPRRDIVKEVAYVQNSDAGIDHFIRRIQRDTRRGAPSKFQKRLKTVSRRIMR